MDSDSDSDTEPNPHPPIYTPNQPRSVPMEVLSLGLPRTGTASMSLALSTLGYTHCAHGMDSLDDPRIAARWETAIDAKFYGRGKPFTKPDFDELLGLCRAVTDMPCAIFWRELLEAYPDAKVVLVERGEEEWFRSFDEGVVGQLYSRAGRFNMKYVEPVLGSRLGVMCVKVLEGFFEAKGKGAEGIRANARRVYRRHYEEVRKGVPKGKLLEYRLGSGWEPLCGFLGKEVPDVEFPRVNDADALKEKVNQVIKGMLNRVLWVLIIPIVGLVLAFFVTWRSGQMLLDIQKKNF